MTLTEDVAELYELHEKILKIGDDEDISPSDLLLKKRANMEVAISRRLSEDLSGVEKIGGQPILDYCIRNTPKSNINNGEPIFRTVFSIMPMVEEFTNYVSQMHGEKILSTHRGIPEEVGIISGPVEFVVDHNSSRLYVPVEKLLRLYFDGNYWEKDSDAIGVQVNPNIFLYPEFVYSVSENSNLKKSEEPVYDQTQQSNGRVWRTNHSMLSHIGRQQENSEIYVGNNITKRELGIKRKIVIPRHEKEIIIPTPNF